MCTTTTNIHVSQIHQINQAWLIVSVHQTDIQYQSINPKTYRNEVGVGALRAREANLDAKVLHQLAHVLAASANDARVAARVEHDLLKGKEGITVGCQTIIGYGNPSDTSQVFNKSMNIFISITACLHAQRGTRMRLVPEIRRAHSFYTKSPVLHC